jgi:hypothetical protein
VTQATDSRRYPRNNERGVGPATNRQLWVLNRAGLLALRKAPDTPLANRQCAKVISELAELRLRERFEREAS